MPVPPGSSSSAGPRLSRAVREFLAAEAAGGVVLVAASVVALVWANSPWDGAYHTLWEDGPDLRHWVNDGLMAVFFFVVGAEIKRELVAGELRDPRQAAVPALAALGGMVVPAGLFVAMTIGSPGERGWGIPTATDIAFALGVVSLFGSRVAPSVKLFLLTLAVVDDIGAILVIAVFYSSDLEPGALALAAALLVGMVAVWRTGVRHLAVYGVAAVAVWAATYESGIHATIAGVALGLLIPVGPGRDGALGDRLQHVLHPVSSFAVVPIFALANAGVSVDGDALDAPGATRLAVAAAVALVIGKPLGVLGATWLAMRSGLGRLPPGSTWGQLTGVAFLAGIGFTVSLFVAGLAFDSASLEAAAKLGVLGASVVAAVLGSALLVRAARSAEADP